MKSESVAMGSMEQVGFNKSTVVGRSYEIAVGDSVISLFSDGSIKIHGKNILISGSDTVKIEGGRVDIN